MKNCILCGKKTKGSIGKAGYYYTFICQECKNEEDEALKRKLEQHNKALEMVFSRLVA